MAERKQRRPALQRSTIMSFWRFAQVGVVGFFVDAGALLLVLELGADYYSGRLFSFAIAVTATWYMNRRFTFKSQNPNWLREWAHFVSANSVGGLVNYLTYAALVTWVALFAEYPVAAVGAGAIAGLIWNFSLSHRFVFKHKGID